MSDSHTRERTAVAKSVAPPHSLPKRRRKDGATDLRAPAAEAARARRLRAYLERVRDAGEITRETALDAWNAWEGLREASGATLPVPDAAPGAGGQLQLAWNHGEHHLELEIFPQSPAEFFYYNRASGETWEAEYTTGAPVSQEVTERLGLFVPTQG